MGIGGWAGGEKSRKMAPPFRLLFPGRFLGPVTIFRIETSGPPPKNSPGTILVRFGGIQGWEETGRRRRRWALLQLDAFSSCPLLLYWPPSFFPEIWKDFVVYCSNFFFKCYKTFPESWGGGGSRRAARGRKKRRRVTERGERLQVVAIPLRLLHFRRTFHLFLGV